MIEISEFSWSDQVPVTGDLRRRRDEGAGSAVIGVRGRERALEILYLITIY